MAADIQRYPVGIQTFSEIREGNFLYIDKTEYIHTLVNDGKYFFLSRPRRFGKSLLLSTIKAFFEGRRDLFEGLAITKYDHDWEPHPVFHLNLVNFNTSSAEGLISILHAHLSGWENIYGRNPDEMELSQRFYGVIRRAVEQTGRKAVILIDEYDKALVSSLGEENRELHDSFRAILKPIYGTLKAADPYIHFALITGVSRFSRLSIFSDINNLNDISLDNKFASICGITHDELINGCTQGVNDLAHNLGISYNEAVNNLKRNYDGYHFTPTSPDIYNPFSLMLAFYKGEIGAYWFATGTPTFLIEGIRQAEVYLPDLLHDEADVTDLADIDSYSGSLTALLFQTGYLTIKSYDRLDEVYHLGIPNREVGQGFFKDLLPQYTCMERGKGLKEIREFNRMIRNGDAEGFLKRLKSFLADIPYNLSQNKPEIYFENNLYIIFKLMGYTVHSEYATSSGRIDLVLKTDDYIYVMELKLTGSADKALAQINDKDYLIPFTRDSRRLFKIGISFSKKTRNISRWKIVEE